MENKSSISNQKNCIYFHIGHPKTGSSAVQSFLHLNKDLLENYNFSYPNSSEPTQIYDTSMGNGKQYYDMFQKNKLEELTNELDMLYATNKNIILSCEAFSKFLLPNNIKIFAKIANRYNYKIILYLREQVGFYESTVNQQIKYHDFYKSIEDYETDMNYGQMLLAALEYISKDNVIVRPYEKEQLLNGNIFDDFLDCLDLQMTKEYKIPNKIINPSLNYTTLEYRRLANITKLDTKNRSMKEVLNKYLADYTVENNQGTAFLAKNYFDINKQKKIKQMHQETNLQIAKVFLNRNDGKLFFNDSLAEKQSEELTTEECFKITKYILNNSKVSYNEDELKLLIVNWTMEKLHGIKDNNSFIDTWSGFKNSKIYELSSIPLKNSRHIIMMNYKKEKLSLTAIGNDPWFVLPNYMEKYSKIVVRIRLSAPSATEMQIFYQKKHSDFSDYFSKTINIAKGENIYSATIKSNFQIEKLRIDPGTRTGKYVINSIEVYI